MSDIERIDVGGYSAPLHMPIEMVARFETATGLSFFGMVRDCVAPGRNFTNILHIREFVYHMLKDANPDIPTLSEFQWDIAELNIAWGEICYRATADQLTEVDENDPLGD